MEHGGTPADENNANQPEQQKCANVGKFVYFCGKINHHGRHQNGGKTQAALCKEYGISLTSLSRWIKQYSTVKTDDGEVLTAKQVKDLQKRNAQLEEELLILKKAIAIFTPHSNND